MFRFILAGSLALALSGCVIAPEQKRRTVEAGDTEKRLSQYLSWNTRSCDPNEVHVTVWSKPENGRVEIREGRSTIGKGRFRNETGACVGEKIPSQDVYYIPDENFKGTDTVVLLINMKPGSWSTEFLIDVK